MSGKRRTYWEFDVDAWLTDPNVRACSVAARGLWFDMLCQMRKCPERGVLKTGNHAWGHREVSAAFGLDHGTSKRLLAELVEKGVTTLRSEDNAYTNRRMTRQQQSVVRKPTQSALLRPDDVVVVSLPLYFRGKVFQLTEPEHQKLQLRYPDWNLRSAYCEMDEWLDDHPEKKRTRFYQFAANWLRRTMREGREYARNGSSEAAAGRGPESPVLTLEQERAKWHRWIEKRKQQLSDPAITPWIRQRWEQDLRHFEQNLAECGRAN